MSTETEPKTDQPETLSPEAVAINLPALAGQMREMLKTIAGVSPEEAYVELMSKQTLLQIAANTLDRSQLKPEGNPDLAEVVHSIAKEIETGALVAFVNVAITDKGDISVFHSGSHFAALKGGLAIADDAISRKVRAMMDAQPTTEEQLVVQAKSMGDLAAAVKQIGQRLDKIKGI